MYKNQRMRVEDGIIPMLLESLMLTHKKQLPEGNTSYDKSLPLIQEDIAQEIKGCDGAARALLRLDNKIIRHFVANKWMTHKCYMIISHLASSLVDAGALELKPNTIAVLERINSVVIDAYVDGEIGEDIKMVDASAAKQTPRVLDILKKEYYF